MKRPSHERVTLRIWSSLDALPVTAEQKLHLLPVLLGQAIRETDLSRLACARNIRDTAALLAAEGVTLRRYLTAAVAHPPLFFCPADAVARHLGFVLGPLAGGSITRQRLIALALRHPQVFAATPEEALAIPRGLSRTLERKGFKVRAYLRAVALRPSLGRVSPRDTAFNLAMNLRVVSQYGLTAHEWIHAIERSPGLWGLSPQDLGERLAYLSNLGQRGGASEVRPATFIGGVLRAPQLLLLSDDNYRLRELYSRFQGRWIGVGRGAGSTLPGDCPVALARSGRR